MPCDSHPGRLQRSFHTVSGTRQCTMASKSRRSESVKPVGLVDEPWFPYTSTFRSGLRSIAPGFIQLLEYRPGYPVCQAGCTGVGLLHNIRTVAAVIISQCCPRPRLRQRQRGCTCHQKRLRWVFVRVVVLLHQRKRQGRGRQLHALCASLPRWFLVRSVPSALQGKRQQPFCAQCALGQVAGHD